MQLSEMIGKIKAKVEEIVFRPVNLDDALVTSGLLDSIAVVDLAVELEKEFGILIAAREINEKNFETLKQIEALISTKTQLH